MPTACLVNSVGPQWTSLNMSGDRKVPAQWGPRLTSLNMFREFSTFYMGDGTGALYREAGVWVLYGGEGWDKGGQGQDPEQGPIY